MRTPLFATVSSPLSSRSFRWPLRLCVGALLVCSGCDKGGDKGDDGKAKAAAADAKTPAAKADGKTPAKAPADAKGDGGKPAAGGDTKVAAAGGCAEGMAAIKGGKFFMGSDSEDAFLKRARPAHKVELAAYCLDINEVTVSEYKQCAGAGECKPAHRDVWWPLKEGGDEEEWKASRRKFNDLCNEGKPDRLNHPVNCITWRQAETYCQWKGKQLPTEAQWEFAARGSDGRVYPWGDEAPDEQRANACDQRCKARRDAAELPDQGTMFDADDGYDGTSPVGSFALGQSQAGLNDMVGNVFEWTADRMYEYTDEPQVDPKGPDDGEDRVIRGGAFNSFNAKFADPAFRHKQNEKSYTHGIGFRCATAGG